jgi:hypothetical protein
MLRLLSFLTCGGVRKFTPVTKMKIGKATLEKSTETLMEKAADCFDLSKTQQNMADKQHEVAAAQREKADQQHDNADQQHALAAKQSISADKIDANADKLQASANKLDTMGQALQVSAAETLGDTMVVQRGE